MSHHENNEFMHDVSCDGSLEFDPLLEKYVCTKCSFSKPHNGTPPEHEEYIAL